MAKSNQEILEYVKQKIHKFNPEMDWICDNLMFLHKGGSHLYGYATPESDTDIRGITVAPKNYWIGVDNFEQIEFQDKDNDFDVVIHDFRKFTKLVLRNSPNIIESLFVNHDNIIYEVPDWRMTSNVLKTFINQDAYKSCHAYGLSQFKKALFTQSIKPSRQNLVMEHGYDTKFAAHGCRLLSQADELNRTGKITFPRPDAGALLQIRQGKLFRDRKEFESYWQDTNDEVSANRKNSVLPKTYDKNHVNSLLEMIYESRVARKYYK